MHQGSKPGGIPEVRTLWGMLRPRIQSDRVGFLVVLGELELQSDWKMRQGQRSFETHTRTCLATSVLFHPIDDDMIAGPRPGPVPNHSLLSTWSSPNPSFLSIGPSPNPSHLLTGPGSNPSLLSTGPGHKLLLKLRQSRTKLGPK